MFVSGPAVDDVEIETGACYGDLSCDFEESYCAYQNTVEDEGHDWLRGRGRLYFATGPEVDHTTGTEKGFYLYINPSTFMPTGLALISSYFY
jgi:hypothetical protein